MNVMRDGSALDAEEAEQLRRLSPLGTATVYEGSGLDCWLDARIRPVWPGARLAGPAYTVRTGPGDNLAIQLAVRAAPAGSVLVVDAGGHHYGHWGEILTQIAVTRGVVGLVIDGSIRDVEEVERMAFPIFAAGVFMRRAAKSDPGTLGEEVTVGGRAVRPGDLIVADADGVVALPRQHLAETVRGATARYEREQQRLATIRSGVIPPVVRDGVKQ
jgi:4-hydroxy-4-methyl-2-oxoglutarate aldolase